MAVELQVFDFGNCKAAADLSSNQFYGVKLSGEFEVDLAGAADAALLGILQNKPRADAAVQVRRVGLSKAFIAATVAVGAQLTTTSTGKLITATSGQRYCCIALEGAISNRTITVLMEFGYVP